MEKSLQFNRRNRGWIEIIGLILSECVGGSVKTRIMYRCNLNSKQIQQYLSFLLDSKLLERKVGETNRMTTNYVTTPLGLKFIKVYQELQEVLSEAQARVANKT